MTLRSCRFLLGALLVGLAGSVSAQTLSPASAAAGSVSLNDAWLAPSRAAAAIVSAPAAARTSPLSFADRQARADRMRSEGGARVRGLAASETARRGGISVTTTADSGPGSFRQAILDANAQSGSGNVGIFFSIPAASDAGCNAASGICVIQPMTSLPALQAGLFVAGYSQPGAVSAEETGDGPLDVTPPQIKIVLDGSLAGATGRGLQLAGNFASVGGVAVVNWGDVGIGAYGSISGVLVYGTFVGVWPDGTTAGGNHIGVQFAPLPGESTGPSGSYIGTGALADGNLIAHNGDGIQVLGAPQAFVGGNSIGLTATASGPECAGNDNNGVAVGYAGSSDVMVLQNLIGCNPTGVLVTLDATYAYVAANVVIGNTYGVDVNRLPSGGGAPVGTHVYANEIGTLLGETGYGNVVGVRVIDAAGSLVGVYGDGPGDDNLWLRNTIRSNLYGVAITGSGATDNTVQNNTIGTDAFGSDDAGNAVSGVYITDGAANNMVGTDTVPNVIAYNGTGVVLTSDAGPRNAIRYNSIYSNADLGIDLGDDGVTANDAGDADGGPNGLQNFPEITGITLGAETSALTGTLTGEPGESYAVDVYVSGEADASGYGEGAIWIGTVTTTVPSSGMATFGTSLPSLGAGTFVSATATGPNVGTSEFGPAFEVEEVDLGPLVVALTGQPTAPVAASATIQFTLSVRDQSGHPVTGASMRLDPSYDPDGDGTANIFYGGEIDASFSDGDTFSYVVPNGITGGQLRLRFTATKDGYTASEPARVVLDVLDPSVPQTARVQLTHASDGLSLLGPIDIYVDDVRQAQGLTYPNGTGFVSLPVGQALSIRIELTSPPAWFPSAAPRSFTVTQTIPAPGTYAITLSGTQADLLPLLGISPSELPAGRAQELAERFVTVVYRGGPTAGRTASGGGVVLYAVHASTDAPTLDVTLGGSGTVLADDLAFGTAGPFVAVTSSSVLVEVRDAATAGLIQSFTLDLSDAAVNDTLQVSITGFVNPSIVDAPAPAPGLMAATVDESGTSDPGQATADEAGVDGALALGAVRPNPLSGATEVAVTLRQPGAATLAVYDVLGRRVAVLAEGSMGAGTTRVALVAGALAPGVYVLRLDAEGARAAQTFTVVR